MTFKTDRLPDTVAKKINQIAWPKAFIGMVTTCILSLSVHVVMLEVLNIPYPVGYPTEDWPIFLNLALTTLALLYFYRLTRDELALLPILVQWLLMFILTAMLREALVRSLFHFILS